MRHQNHLECRGVSFVPLKDSKGKGVALTWWCGSTAATILVNGMKIILNNMEGKSKQANKQIRQRPRSLKQKGKHT